MSKFKAGDLALVIRAPKNFGRCVELISRHVGPQRVDYPGNAKNGWCLVPEGEVGWLVTAERLKNERVSSGAVCECDFAVFKERGLAPLRGDFQPEQQKSREVPA